MRVFLGLPLFPHFEEEIRNFLSAYSADSSLRWTRAEDVHVTLHFFGDVQAAKLDVIDEHVRRAASACKPFEISLEGAGFFPEKQSARILWLGVNAVPSFFNCRMEIEAGLRQAGFQCEDREFKAHATVGRYKNPGPGGNFAFPKTSSRNIENLCLYQSRLQPSGSRYEIIRTWPLAPSA